MTDPMIDAANAIPAASQLRRSRFRWRLVAFVALAIAIVALVGRFTGELVPSIAPASIARVTLNGFISTDAARLRVLEKLGDTDSVKAVIVSINSPGGSSAGGEELYQALTELRAKKPVVAVIGELGASAAYMAAIASDRIFARRLSIVGSIGVFFESYNAQKLLDTIGIGLDKIASGPLKGEPDIDKPMSPEVRASLQSLIDDSYRWFVDIVAERRGLARPDALALADGRVLTGNQGIATKLIDEVGGEREAIAWLVGNKHIAKDMPVVTWYPEPQSGLAGVGKWLGAEARAAVGLPADGPIALDGLVSLWQVAR